MRSPLAVSFIVHTLNEQINLPHALESVCGRSSEVFVVDAGSTDGTKEIVAKYGATFVQISGNRSTLVKQRNWALDNLPFKNEWVYILDADEKVPDDLYAEIAERVDNPLPNVDGYWVRYKEIIFGRWLKRSSIYPNWNLRLFKHHAARYEDRKVNAHIKIDHTRTAQLTAHFIHEDRRGFSSYVKRLSDIAVLEALSLEELYSSGGNLIKASLFSPSFVERRRALKKIYYQLPFRPLLIFFYLYFFRLGLLEGKAGLYNSLYRACNELISSMLRYESQLISKMATSPSCLCGAKDLRRIRSPSFGKRKLYSCKSCTMVQLFPWPEFDTDLENIYQDASYLSKIPREEYYGYFKVIEEYLRLDLNVRKDVAILDFGAGGCYYHKFFLEERYLHVHSLEINRHLVRQAREKLGLANVFESVEKLPTQHYDVVISNQVFEHLANPLQTLSETILGILKPNGIVCFTVPNWDSLNRPVLRKRWVGYSPEDHVWFFSRRSIESLLSNSSRYELLDIRSRSAVGKPYDGFKPNGFVKRLYYNSFWRLFEKLGRGDQLIVTLRKKG